ncbi:PREDICTED: protein COFACTOR ASSEMBLY OF COMPLEX C SUBUNIT B CCB3, chloroplastic [Lupinus angustifolius]|uniref:protein COFACTOR ASSEMBLY OF COMPLEX C SUBUNIT B CCB3, chloroplastic n=1 Tax=Lupinus angustifolius TaxID=3871 RepID=UPI00092E7E36|nr:PREDICTED: protein COFACTOR ASSEMBLY OF COMPLEX C SUBUNIT B CCB3, chloroplastic [Lupinus angustifolius]
MATQSYLLNSLYVTGLQPSILKPRNFGFSQSSKYPTKRKANSSTWGATQCCSCHTEILHAATTQNCLDSDVALNTLKLSIPGTLCPSTDFFSGLVLADLDPATAKLAIGFLGPFLSAFGFLFILRIVMSWYPKLPVGKFPYVIAYAPTEPLLSPTRKVIPPLAGVDVSPVVWFGLISFLNEILVGPQGLLVLLSQKIN